MRSATLRPGPEWRASIAAAHRFLDRHAVAVDVRSPAYANLWLRSPDPRLPVPDLRHWHRYRRQPGLPISEPGLWVPLSCAIALVTSVKFAQLNTGTSGAIDTTGANLLVLSISEDSASSATISDSKSNTWTALATSTSTNVKSTIYYVASPTVGSGHTFTSTGLVQASLAIASAWSGANSTPFDQENGQVSNVGGTSLQTGSVTPSENDELLIAMVGCNAEPLGGTFSVDLSFTIVQENIFVAGTNYAGAQAYQIQTTATAINPTFSWTGSSNNKSARIATFKIASGGGGGAQNLLTLLGVGV